MIRPMQLGDAGAVAALLRRVFGALTLDPPSSALQETEATMLAHLERGGGFVAGPDLAGCVLWAEKAGALYLGRLAVSPAARGRGVAAALVGAVEQEARRRGLPRVHLGVRLALEGNRRLFTRLGFTETAQHAHPGHTVFTTVDAEKWLTASPSGTGTPPGSPGAPPPAAPSSGRSQG